MLREGTTRSCELSGVPTAHAGKLLGREPRTAAELLEGKGKEWWVRALCSALPFV